MEDLARNRRSWPRRSSGRRIGGLSVLCGAAEELVERALHDLGWPGREAHEKTVGLLSPRIDGNVEREYGLEKQRALTYFDPKK